MCIKRQKLLSQGIYFNLTAGEGNFGSAGVSQPVTSQQTTEDIHQIEENKDTSQQPEKKSDTTQTNENDDSSPEDQKPFHVYSWCV